MNISAIYPKMNYNPVSFGKDKYFLYADFDRTLSPMTTGDVFYAKNTKKINNAKTSFSQMDNLLEKSKDNLSLIITTGRALVEMKVMQDLYRKQGIEIPKAKSFIIKNGSEEFISNEEDYLRSTPNNERTEEIVDATDWDNDKFNNIAEDILDYYGFEPVYAKTTLSAEKYSPYSIFSEPEKIKDNSVIFRDVGKAKVFYGFPPIIEEQNITLFKKEFEDKLDDMEIKYNLTEKYADMECGGFHSLLYSPVIDNHILEKDYDTRMALKKAKINDDTVIVAGDSSNDFTMLNPVTYLEHFPEDEDRNDLENALSIINSDETLKQELKDLPLISIISVKTDEKEKNLEKLNEYFGQTSEYKKVVTTREGELPQTVSDIISNSNCE